MLFVGGPVAVAQEIGQRQIDGVVPGEREGGQNAHVIHTKKLGIPGAESEGRATAFPACRAELIRGQRTRAEGRAGAYQGPEAWAEGRARIICNLWLRLNCGAKGNDRVSVSFLCLRLLRVLR